MDWRSGPLTGHPEKSTDHVCSGVYGGVLAGLRRHRPPGGGRARAATPDGDLVLTSVQGCARCPAKWAHTQPQQRLKREDLEGTGIPGAVFEGRGPLGGHEHVVRREPMAPGRASPHHVPDGSPSRPGGHSRMTTGSLPPREPPRPCHVLEGVHYVREGTGSPHLMTRLAGRRTARRRTPSPGPPLRRDPALRPRRRVYGRCRKPPVRRVRAVIERAFSLPPSAVQVIRERGRARAGEYRRVDPFRDRCTLLGPACGQTSPLRPSAASGSWRPCRAPAVGRCRRAR